MFKHINTLRPTLRATKFNLHKPQFNTLRMVHSIASANEFRESTASGKVLVDFFATWCGPCKMVSPLIEKLDTQYSDIKFFKLDIEAVPEIASELEVSTVPTFILYNDGKVVNIVRGAAPPKIKAALDELK